MTESTSQPITKLCDSFWEGLKPDPLLTVSEWADQYRFLSQRASAEPGLWRTSRTPYLKEIMDCFSALSPIEEIVFVKSAQIGGTEAINNCIGYLIDYAPAPAIAVSPTVDMAKRTSKQRIAPLIEESPRLREKVKTSSRKDSGNTLLSKEFPGGVLVLTGANSATGLRSMPARYALLDEIDAYPLDIDGEGDPVTLAEARTRTFARRKIFKVSTPTIEGVSRIQSAYDASDKRRYWVPCPLCGEFQTLKFSQLKWPEGKPHEVMYFCEHCQKQFEEFHKTSMLARGEWRAENPGARGGKVAGYHINSLCSPMGWFSWRDVVEAFLKSKDDPTRLKVFVNTILGETWKEKGEAPEWEEIFKRRESYPLNTVPKGVFFLTAGCDVQKDRLEVEVVGWGPSKESWSIDYRVFMGDPAAPEVWKHIDNLLQESWKSSHGIDMEIKRLAVDSGFHTQHVYAWVRRQSISRVMAIKGTDSSSVLVAQPKAIDVTIAGRIIKRGVKLWMIGSSMAKDELYSWLKMKQRSDATFPPGFCHFPEYGEDYFKQLTAEILVATKVKGFTHYEWQKIRERNEALDCRVMARSAASSFGLDRFGPKHWQALGSELGEKTPDVPSPRKTEEKTKSPKPPRPKRESIWNR